MNNLILDALEQTAARLPEKIAFADEQTEVSFSALVRRAQSVAAALIPLVPPRSVVGFYMDKGVETVVGFMGAVYAGWLYGDSGITLAGALALSLGIAIQNFPEGAIISMPLKAEGLSNPCSFLYGTLSGAVEPVGAILTILLAGILVPVLPYALSFAAGAMIYVVVEELIPEMSAGRHSNVGTILFAVGFTLMMVLDVALG